MSARERLLNEIEHATDSMLEEMLNFCLLLKEQGKASESDPTTSSEKGIASLLDLVAQIHAQVPPEEWETWKWVCLRVAIASCLPNSPLSP
jgi:hypothetical protein